MLKNSLVLVLCVIAGIAIGIAFDRTVLLRLTEPEAIAIPDTSYARFHCLHLFNVYGGDLNATNTEIKFCIPIPECLTIGDKLELLARKLSYYKFGGLPIEFVKLIESGTDRIAVINLREKRCSRDRQMTGYTWSTGFFQGSSGGWSTGVTLRETFLQREYNGEWINAVRFLYENEPIGPADWDHFTLSGTQYSDLEL